MTGDAVDWIDSNDVHQGLKFDGRIAEDFKLSTGTFVSVGPMRAKIIAFGAPYVQDVVITGLNRSEVGALLFPAAAIRELAALPAGASLQQVLQSAPVQAHFQQVVNQLAAQGTGSANRVARLHLLREPASIDQGEVTDKGSINQRAVLKHRDALVQDFHDGKLPFTLHTAEGQGMNIQGQAALVTGGASGLGEATARELARLGAKVAVLDVNGALAEKVAAEINGVAIQCDITSADSVAKAIAQAAAAHGPARILMNIAGIGSAKRVVQKDGNAAPLEDFARVVNINLIGTYNVSRLFAAECARLAPLEDGERGVMLFTASVAAFDGQVGQQAYSASKGGLTAMTLPMARDLAQHAIRVCTVAPGLFSTPLMKSLPEPVQQSLAASIPFPQRLGKPEEFAQLACHIVTNTHLNGEVIRLDGALRMAPADSFDD